MNRPITSKIIESVIKNFLTDKNLESDGFPGEFYKTVKEELIPILLKLLQEIYKEEVMLPNSLYKASITLIPTADKDTTKKKTTGQQP